MKTMALEKTDMTSMVSSDTSKVFLFSKTLSSAGISPGAIDAPDFSDSVFSEEARARFSDAFPGILTGQIFVDDALKKMKDSGFSVLLIRSDSRANKLEADAAVSPFLLNGGFIMQQLTEPLHAVWGAMNPDALGCMVPQIDLSACRRLAETIQHQLSEFLNETASIGIAVYPTSGYSRGDTVNNAWKALIHAAIVGPGSRVVMDAVSLNISADTLYQSGNLQGAVLEYQQALRIDPCSVNVRNSLGVCYGIMEMYDAAEIEFDAALDLKPDEVMALYNMGVICLLTGRKETALSFFMRAAAIDDGIFELALFTGKLHLEAGDLEQARSFLEKAVNCRPKSGTALRTLGACLLALDQPRKAIEVYTRAVKNNPNDAESLSQLGQLYDTIGENPEIARLFCRQSVGIAPENELYRQRLKRLMQK